MSQAFRKLAEAYLWRLKDKLSTNKGSMQSSIDEREEIFADDSALRSIESTFSNTDIPENIQNTKQEYTQIKIIQN